MTFNQVNRLDTTPLSSLEVDVSAFRLRGTTLEIVNCGNGYWKVSECNLCLGLDGEWYSEPLLNSNRTPEFYAKTRFTSLQEAIDAARNEYYRYQNKVHSEWQTSQLYGTQY